MKQTFHTVSVATNGPGLYEITGQLAAFLRGLSKGSGGDGLVTCFIRHTSASLLIQENADPDVQKDLQDFFAHLAKNGMDYRHTAEGPDDMPSHIRAALTQTSIGIPVKAGKAMLGTWQGLYVFEHRDAPHRREVTLYYAGD
jgi:secondary thiamine-phosphate synthase enzyme